MAPSLELVYFTIRGRADLPRCILMDAGVEFKETLIPREQWPSRKPEEQFVFGQMPVMIVEGKGVLAQTAAIARYCCSIADSQLLGKDDFEAAEVDMWFHQADDVYIGIIRPFYTAYDTVDQLFKDNWVQWMAPFERRLAGGVQFLVANRLTLADYQLFGVLEICAKKDAALIDLTPNVKQFYERMLQRPGIAKFRQQYKDLLFTNTGKF